jgi:FKBP-type peptidyl-prolyl cis-trans isomerase
MPHPRHPRGALTAAALCTLLFAAASAQTPSTPETAPATTPAAPPAPDPTLLVTDLVKGVGDEALPGMVVIVHYTGWLYDPVAKDHHGRKFDSSRDRRQPFSFPLGSAHVIRGWEQGIPGMKVGGTRRLVIPPALAYGEKGAGNGVIPPNATLLFEVELLAVESVTRHEQ